MKSVESLWNPTWRHLSSGIALGLVLFGAKNTFAAEFYVAPTGSDSNPGTLASPFATLQKGNSAAAAGDTVWLRGGTYASTSEITLSKSGTSDSNRTKIWAYKGEVPVLDFSKYVSSNPAVDVPAVLVTGSWMHLKGIEIANGAVGASGAHSYSLLRTKNASNNTFELLNIHHGFGPGLFIDTGNGGNLILNCDSHDNYDKDGSQGDGQNGDGFGVHYQTTGPSTIIRGCRAWVDSDDGYDFISQEVPVTIENSFAIQNGYANGGSTSPADGNGNGFKIGSSQTGVRHIVQNNVAWKNKAAGFYANHSSGGNTWLNNTSYKNGVQYNMLASPAGDSSATITLTGALAHKMRNNIGFPNKNSNMGGVDSASNTWDLGISEADTDFVSTADTGCTGPREADGSLPVACTFMKLKAGSPLIDKGVDVGLDFVGSAPDLGAYEYGAPASTGTGGSGAGSGGISGSGGSGGNTSRDASPGSGGAPVDGSAGSGGANRADGSASSGGSSSSGGAGTIGNSGGGGGLGGAGGTFAGGSGGATGAGGLVGTGGAKQGSGGTIAAASGGTSGGTGDGTGGATAKSGSGGTAGAVGGIAGGTGGTGGTGGLTTGGTAGSSGCGCTVGARFPRGGTSVLWLAGLIALLARRRANHA